MTVMCLLKLGGDDCHVFIKAWWLTVMCLLKLGGDACHVFIKAWW